MERIEKTFELEVPLRTAYNQWTQFEDFPLFVPDVLDVDQVDDAQLRWRVLVEGSELDWDVDTPHTGEVRFFALPDERTRVSLWVEYEPMTDTAKAAQTAELVSRSLDKAAGEFKRFIEQRGAETGGWRGEIHGGLRTGPAGVGTPDEPLPGPDF